MIKKPYSFVNESTQLNEFVLTAAILTSIVAVGINQGFNWVKSIIVPTRQQALARAARMLRNVQLKNNDPKKTEYLVKVVRTLSTMSDEQYIVARHQLGGKDSVVLQ